MHTVTFEIISDFKIKRGVAAIQYAVSKEWESGLQKITEIKLI